MMCPKTFSAGWDSTENVTLKVTNFVACRKEESSLEGAKRAAPVHGGR